MGNMQRQLKRKQERELMWSQPKGVQTPKIKADVLKQPVDEMEIKRDDDGFLLLAMRDGKYYKAGFSLNSLLFLNDNPGYLGNNDHSGKVEATQAISTITKILKLAFMDFHPELEEKDINRLLPISRMPEYLALMQHEFLELQKTFSGFVSQDDPLEDAQLISELSQYEDEEEKADE